MTLEQVEGHMAQDSEVFRCVVQTHARGIFGKSHIEGPMEGIFNGPMSTGSIEDALGIGGQAGDALDTPPQ